MRVSIDRFPPALHGLDLQWTRKIDGRTVAKLLNPDQRDRCKDWFDNHRKLRHLIAELEATLAHHHSRRDRRLGPRIVVSSTESNPPTVTHPHQRWRRVRCKRCMPRVR